MDDRQAGAERRFCDVLEDLAMDEARERVSVGDLLDRLGERAYGALMLAFALPNIVPTPPGTSAITGAPLVFLAARLALGLSPRLPDFLTRRSMARGDFAVAVNRIAPWLRRAERLLRPRLRALTGAPGDRAAGLVCLALAVVLALPIPLANILPAVSICLFALALIGRDGLFWLAGLVFAGLSMAVAGGVVFAFLKAAFLAASLFA